MHKPVSRGFPSASCGWARRRHRRFGPLVPARQVGMPQVPAIRHVMFVARPSCSSRVPRGIERIVGPHAESNRLNAQYSPIAIWQAKAVKRTVTAVALTDVRCTSD